MSLEERAQATYEFTYESLTSMIAAGVDVQMVQVGNETNGGNVAGVTGWSDGTKIFDAGSRAVRAVSANTGRDTQIALHFTDPQKAGLLYNAAAELDAAGVDYNIFASSYYAFWHGSLENLTSVLDKVADTFGKKVMVAETSWNFTDADGDGHENTIPSASNAEAESKYASSVQGQATAVRDVIQAVVDVKDAKGVGVFYWEPAWVPVGTPEQIEDNRVLWERDGSGWAASYAGDYSTDAALWYGGSSWDNQALFNFDGHALESVNVFNSVRTGAIAPLEVTSVDTVHLSFKDGEAVVLPDTVNVNYNDGSTAARLVTWEEAGAWIDGAGSYRIVGITQDGDEALAEVTVLATNLLLNPSFEDADTSMWHVTGPGTTVRSTDTPRTGDYSFHFWNADAAEMTLSQTVTVNESGEYKASAFMQGAAEGEYTAELVISSATETSSGAFTPSGWMNWSSPTAGPLHVTAGSTVTVEAKLVMPAGAWGNSG